MIQLVILDRDGVVNHDSDQYIRSAAEWLPIEGSLAAIARLNRAGLKVGIATNQSGLARGYYGLSELDAMHEKFGRLLAEHQGHWDALRFCPHGPKDGCDCRKPLPGMLQALANELQVQADQVLFIGDSDSDRQAAEAFGCPFWLVRTGKGERTLQKSAAARQLPCFDNLAQAVEQLLNTKAQA